MNRSILPLILLLVFCFSLSFFVGRKDGFTQVSELSQIPEEKNTRKQDTIQRDIQKPILDSFLPFKNYEPFTLKDETGKEYQLNEENELFNVDGELRIGKHDATDYASLLESVKNDYENLRSQTPARCDEDVKCIADFGTNIGEDLCCGQTGVLQDTRYVCPSNKPTCSKFKCGSIFGTCS